MDRAAVICWLAWKMASTSIHPTETSAQPLGLFRAAAFQWINPKSWLAVTSGAATFLDASRGSAALQALVLALIFAAVSPPYCGVWLAFGAPRDWCTQGRQPTQSSSAVPARQGERLASQNERARRQIFADHQPRCDFRHVGLGPIQRKQRMVVCVSELSAQQTIHAVLRRCDLGHHNSKIRGAWKTASSFGSRRNTAIVV